jgi:hypothetical protein
VYQAASRRWFTSQPTGLTKQDDGREARRKEHGRDKKDASVTEPKFTIRNQEKRGEDRTKKTKAGPPEGNDLKKSAGQQPRRRRRKATKTTQDDDKTESKPKPRKGAVTEIKEAELVGEPLAQFSLQAHDISCVPVDVPDQPAVPRLHNDLDRVLFSPGVHFLKDPRTNVYNFSKHFERIMSIKDFDFGKIPAYVPSGKDSRLARLAEQYGQTYTGSTSSLTSLFTHLHFALSHDRPPHLMGLSKFFPSKLTTFTNSQKSPASIFLRYDDTRGVYKVDASRAKDDEIIVMLLGQELEIMLTSTEDEFETFRKNSNVPSPNASHTYHYTSCGDLLMRSQLDCKDERLPGTGVFDLKTRAVCAIRHDLDYVQIHDGSNYHITKLDGEYESYSREWHDLVRSSLFKYSLQARIGRMDGIFVAYHNARKMFGFQYVPLSEMDKVFHTSHLLPREKQRALKPRALQKGTKDGDGESKEKVTSVTNPPIRNGDHHLLDDAMSQCASVIADAEFKLSTSILTKVFDTIRAIGDARLCEATTADVGKDVATPSYSIMMASDGPDSLTVLAKPMKDSDIESIQQDSAAHLERCIATHSSESHYGYGADPFCLILRGSDKLISEEIPDLISLRITVKQTINGLQVDASDFPKIDQSTDNWSAEVTISELSADASRSKYLQMVRHVAGLGKYKTTPRTERLSEEEEESYRVKSLLELDEPTGLQRLLRKLSAKYDSFDD